MNQIDFFISFALTLLSPAEGQKKNADNQNRLNQLSCRGHFPAADVYGKQTNFLSAPILKIIPPCVRL